MKSSHYDLFYFLLCKTWFDGNILYRLGSSMGKTKEHIQFGNNYFLPRKQLQKHLSSIQSQNRVTVCYIYDFYVST